MAAKGPKYSSVAEIAEQLGVSAAHVYRLVQAGEIRALKMGRLVRITDAALEDYIRRHTVGPADGPAGDQPATGLRAVPGPEDMKPGRGRMRGA